MAESELHKKLKKEGVEWLNQTGCFVVAEEVSFRGELFDVVGFKRNGVSYCLEAKATKKDLDDGRQKKQILNEWKKNFTFYYLILPEELKPDYEWSDWGIIRVPFANTLGHKLPLLVERRAKRCEVDRYFGDTIELIIQMAASLTNKIYYRNDKTQS